MEGKGRQPEDFEKGLPARVDGSVSLQLEGSNLNANESNRNEVGASISSGVFNLSTSVIGAGIMALPAKMAITGLPLGLLILVLFGFIAEYSIQILIRCSVSSRTTSYSDLMLSTHGRLGKQVTNVLVVINNLGILVIYLIIIGDVMSGSDSSTGLLQEWAGGYHWWMSRPIVLLVTCSAILSPLVSLKHVDSLHWSSLLAILLAGVFLIVTIGVTIFRLIHGSINFSSINWTPTLASTADYFALFTVVPTIAAAYVCHFNVHAIFMETREPRLPNMQFIVQLSLFICTVVYSTTGLFGYLLFGDSVEDDILSNFDSDLGVPLSSFLCDLVRATFAAHLMMVFPVIHFSLRSSLDSMIFPTSKPLAEDGVRFGSLTFTAMAATLFIALTVPNISSAFDVTGSIASITLAFTLPGMVGISKPFGLEGSIERGVAWALVVMGITFSLLGIVSDIGTTFFGFQ